MNGSSPTIRPYRKTIRRLSGDHQPASVSPRLEEERESLKLKEVEKVIMGRWPDQSRSTLITFLLIFVLFPLLALLAWWFVRG